MNFTIPVQISGYLRYGHIEGTLSKSEYEEYCNLESEQARKDYLVECGQLVIDSYRIEDITYEEVEFEQKCVNATDRCVGLFPCPYCEIKND